MKQSREYAVFNISWVSDLESWYQPITEHIVSYFVFGGFVLLGHA